MSSAPAMKLSWTLHPPPVTDPEYPEYVAAQEAEAAHLEDVIAAAEPPGDLWEGVPDITADPAYEPDRRPFDVQVAAYRAVDPPDPRFGGMDAADLLSLDLAPLRMIVPDMLAEGTTILAAPPKVGKSCLVYQLVVEVAIGGELLGRRVEPGSALYLALEDGQRRGQDRLRAALGDRTMPRGRLEVRWSASKIGEGLEDELVEWLDAHPDAAVVAVDTLQRARARTNGKRNAYEVDVEDLGRLQAVFRDRRVALLVVHHSRKETGDDFLASVSGTYGITGSADSIVVIKRKRMEEFGSIVATGRDIPEAEIAARFDGMLWHEAPHVLGSASFERAEVYRVIEDSGPIFPAAIAKQLGMLRTSVQNIVERLREAGAVERVGGGWRVTNARARVPRVSDDSDSHSSHGGHRSPLTTGLSVSEEMASIFEGRAA